VVGSNIFNVLFVLGLAALIAANDRGFGAGAAFRTGRPDRAPGRAPFVGVSQLVIGLTMIAAGTSLPELAPSLLASIRGERDIAVWETQSAATFSTSWRFSASAGSSLPAGYRCPRARSPSTSPL
jgi:hypothetical protein